MRDLFDVVDDRLPRWRQRRPYRTRAAAWPAWPVEIAGRQVEVFSLPTVKMAWFTRGRRYWFRRLSLLVCMVAAVATVTTIDVGVGQAAAENGQLGWFVPVLVLLFLAGGFFYMRSDLFARAGTPGVEPLPGPVKAVGILVGLAGLMVTPGWTLGLLWDLIPRFPVQERVAWDYLVFQLSTSDKATGTPVHPG